MTRPLLEVENLQLFLSRGSTRAKILNDVSFNVFPGETVGLVGESGSGKSMTASAILGLLPNGHTVTGHMSFEGQNLADIPHPRGTGMSLILQDPAMSLNPLIAIGPQLIEGLIYHKKMDKRQAWARGIEWLEKVGLRNPAEKMKQFPHELSGGMKQRVLIAMALICSPSLLIADEPTTALDATVQIQVLELLQALQQEQRLSILLITHDLGVVAHSCRRAMVMYAGQIVESGPVEAVFENPRHPYTQALLKSRKSLSRPGSEALYSLEGSPPSSIGSISGCPFAPRCPEAMQICLQRQPPKEKVPEGEYSCWHPAYSRRAP